MVIAIILGGMEFAKIAEDQLKMGCIGGHFEFSQLRASKLRVKD